MFNNIKMTFVHKNITMNLKKSIYLDYNKFSVMPWHVFITVEVNRKSVTDKLYVTLHSGRLRILATHNNFKRLMLI